MRTLVLLLFSLLTYTYTAHACNGLNGIPSIPAGGIPSIPGGGGGIGGKGSHSGGKKHLGRCLHKDANVLMADGQSWKKAGDLVIGDRVWAGDGQSTAIILTPAVDIKEPHPFIVFETKTGLSTAMTPDHAVFARPCGITGDLDSWPIKRSGDLTIGECVPAADGGEDRVVSVSLVDQPGRVHPITANGRIVVDGIVVSCYDYDGDNSTQEQRHAPLEPARALYSVAEKIYYTLSNDQFAISVLDSLIRGMGLEKLYYQ